MNDNIRRFTGPRPRHYVLRGKVPHPVNDLMEWAKMVEERRAGEHDPFRVAFTDDGPWHVSTVFLSGLDHNFSGEGPPLLFETMIFHRDDPGLDHDCLRTSTWEEAEVAHALMVARCRKTGTTGA